MSDRIQRERQQQQQQSAFQLHNADDSTIQSMQSMNTMTSSMTALEAERLMRLCLGEAEFMRLQQAVQVMQSVVRTFLAQSSYLKFRRAVIQSQSLVRARLERLRFAAKLRLLIQTRDAAIQWQALWRAYSTRSNYLDQKYAATIMQALFRGNIDRTIVNIVKQMRRRVQLCSIVRIQATWRCYLAERLYLTLRRLHPSVGRAHQAIVTVQSQVRCYIAVKTFQKCRSSAIMIQSLFRRFAARTNVSTRRARQRIAAAVRAMKDFWRAHQETRDFVADRAAAVTYLHQVHGCNLKFRRIQLKLLAATNIANAWRRYKAQRTFQAAKQAATTIQANIRRYLAIKQYLQGVVVVMQLQAVLRGHCERRRATVICTRRRVTLAAVVVQSQCRTWHAQQNLVTALIATRRLQSCWRRFWVVRLLDEQGTAALTIQAFQRGCVARREAKFRWTANQMMNAATKIQCLLRCHLQRKHWRIVRLCIITIQAHIRRNHAVDCFQRRLLLVIRLQAVIRGSHERHRAIELYDCVRQAMAATKLASMWRAAAFTRRYLLAKRSMVKIQACLRANQHERQFAKYKGVIKRLQAVTRAYLVRREAKGVLVRVKQHEAAVEIQAIIRGHVARCQTIDIIARAQQHMAAIKLQAAIRGHVARCQTVDILGRAQQHMAAISVQAVVRGHIERCQTIKLIARVKQHAAAITIQNCLRRLLAQKLFGTRQSAILLLQSVIRRRSAMMVFQRQRAIIVKTQTTVRGRLARLATAQLRAQNLRNKASLMMCCYWRSFAARSAYQSAKKAAITIQACVRRHRVSRQLVKQNAAVIKMQSSIRKYQARRRVRRLRAITRLARLRSEALRKEASAIQIQTTWRRKLAHQALKLSRQSTVVLQTWVRRRHAMRLLHQRRLAALQIQSFFRRLLAVKHVKLLRSITLAMSRSAVQIQSNVRLFLAKRSFRTSKANCTKLQAQVRAHQCRALLREMIVRKRGAQKIQATLRGHLCRTAERFLLLRRTEAVILIIEYWRRYKCRKESLARVVATTKIQCMYRCNQARLVYEEVKLEKVHLSALAVQRYWRKVQCCSRYSSQRRSAIKIQATVRMHIASQQGRCATAAAVLIQSFIRCVLCRKLCRRLRTRNMLIVTSMFFRRKWVPESTGKNLSPRLSNQDNLYSKGALLKWKPLTVVRGSQIPVATVPSPVTALSAPDKATERQPVCGLESVCLADEISASRQGQCAWQRHDAHGSPLISVERKAVKAMAEGLMILTDDEPMLLISSNIDEANRNLLGNRQHQMSATEPEAEPSFGTMPDHLENITKNQCGNNSSDRSESKAVTVQAAWRRYCALKGFVRRKHSARIVLRAMRFQKARNVYKRQVLLEQRATVIQASWRRYLAHGVNLKRRAAALCIQRAYGTYITSKMDSSSTPHATCEGNNCPVQPQVRNYTPSSAPSNEKKGRANLLDQIDTDEQLTSFDSATSDHFTRHGGDARLRYTDVTCKGRMAGAMILLALFLLGGLVGQRIILKHSQSSHRFHVEDQMISINDGRSVLSKLFGKGKLLAQSDDKLLIDRAYTPSYTPTTLLAASKTIKLGLNAFERASNRTGAIMTLKDALVRRQSSGKTMSMGLGADNKTAKGRKVGQRNAPRPIERTDSKNQKVSKKRFSVSGSTVSRNHGSHDAVAFKNTVNGAFVGETPATTEKVLEGLPVDSLRAAWRTLSSPTEHPGAEVLHARRKVAQSFVVDEAFLEKMTQPTSINEALRKSLQNLQPSEAQDENHPDLRSGRLVDMERRKPLMRQSIDNVAEPSEILSTSRPVNPGRQASWREALSQHGEHKQYSSAKNA
ncbi:hypothetical protein MPSEU_001006600 [Mayamaea pseudoterrestris]|nr:hypothetical protein MPSEU_001006600 [Mayamaea pseudoterrestris]